MTPGESYTAQNEGRRNTAYQDTRGIWTIGIGCTGPSIGPGTIWTDDQIDVAFEQRYTLAQNQACADLGSTSWVSLDEIRQAALTDMAFNLGGAGLSEFVNMLAAIRVNQWQSAHDALLNSAYAKQLPVRANKNAYIILTGQWR